MFQSNFDQCLIKDDRRNKTNMNDTYLIRVSKEMVSVTNSMDMNLSKLQETVEDRGTWGATAHGVAKSKT